MNHRLTEEEKYDRKRSDELYEKARAEKRAEVEEQVFNKFFYAHRIDGIYFQANVQLMREWLKEKDLKCVLENLELAFQDLGDRLAKNPQPYEKQTEPRIPVSQRKSHPTLDNPTEIVLNLTAEEIRAMHPEKLRKLMARPEIRRELDRILAVKI